MIQNSPSLVLMIVLPALFGGLMLLLPKKPGFIRNAVLVLGFGANLALNIAAFGKELSFSLPFAGWGIDFELGTDHFSRFILLSAAAITFLVSVYTASFSKGKDYPAYFYAAMLFTLAMVNGAVLAVNLAVLLFFWEAILATMFAMIMAGGKYAYKTSIKAVIIAGATDLCMMLGIGMVWHLTGTLDMRQLNLPLESWGIAAFALLAAGAVSKAGGMPFHTWIPDAADNAPMPFMAFLPGALEKLLGIYLLSRLCGDLFRFEHGSPVSLAMMILGACTIIFAVMMALIQRDFKRLLSYHAVSQVGYMILGLGTELPVGMVGALYHMFNNALYKCCLFMAAGAVEKQTGTTNLNVLGGLRQKMPVTFACFLIAALSIAGFPMTNGFFSKELIFDGALESGLIFYIIAAVGAFFTPVSFLKLGHAVFFGRETEQTKNAKEAPVAILVPMIALALSCLAAGFAKDFMINSVFVPVLGAEAAAEHIGAHTNWALVGISAGLLALACLDHYLGFKRTGKGVEAADHYHYAPVLHSIYSLAEKKRFDPYAAATPVINAYAALSLKINDAISRFYDAAVVRLVNSAVGVVRWAHNGNESRYVLWVLFGVALTAAIFFWPW